MKTKTNCIPVFYEGHDDYAGLVAVSMTSVCINTQAFIDFYILDCGLSLSQRNKLSFIEKKYSNCSLTFIKIDLSRFVGLKGYGKGNFLDCYARLLIPELKPEINKAIYLDADTIVASDISTYYHEDLQGSVIGGVYDKSFMDFKFIKAAGIEDGHPYIQAGSLLIDCQKWRADNITEKCFDNAVKYKEHLGAIIEDLLNATLTPSQYRILPFKYGYTELPNRSRYLSAANSLPDDLFDVKNEDMCVIHFGGPNKPWITHQTTYYVDQKKLTKDLSKQSTIHFFSDFWDFAYMTPFYAGLKQKFDATYMESQNERYQSKKYDLLNFIPLLKVERKKHCKIYKLANFIPVFQIRTVNKSVFFKLFNFIPLLRIKEK